MRSFRNGGLAAMVAGAAMALTTVFAGAANAMPPPIPPPAPGVAPGTAVVPTTLIPPVDLFYTAPDRTVWLKEGVGSGGPPIPLTNGRLVSGPAPIWTGSTEMVFGRGPDNRLWYSQISNDHWTDWQTLGGTLTSQPGAAALGGGAYAVFVRGADGAVWQRVHAARYGAPGSGLAAGCCPEPAPPPRISPVAATSTSGWWAPTGRCI
jgi:hypothetical protein